MVAEGNNSGGLAADLRSWGWLAVLALAWGSGFLWTDLALTEGVPPSYLAFGRGVVASVVLLLLGRPRWREWKGRGPRLWDLVSAAVLCNVMPFTLFAIGQQTVASGIAGVLNATTPLWAALLELAARRGRTVGPRQLAGVAVGFAGVCLVFAPWRAGVALTIGVPMILLAAAGYAAGFVLMARRLIPSAASPAELAGLQMTVATVLLAIPVPFARESPAPTAIGLVAVTMLGLLCTAFTFAIAYRMLAAEGATRTAVVGYLVPVVAILLGAIFLHEGIGATAIAGMALVLAGVALTRSVRRLDRIAEVRT
ncbi:DMT family transporter [Kribbella sp. NPDC048915]|uniref:DMT family transporter n=1 Tax=Kribbella sp. NPDC048915 TaxID=3155148 RepID=UPI0033CB3C58